MRLPESFTFRRKPGGIFKWLLRVPVWLFTIRLGFLFGDRFLVLVHRGRRSGVLRRTALEVVAVGGGEYFVCSGTGPRADWYLNLQKEPALEIWVGSRRFRPHQRFLGAGEAAEVFEAYESAHPETTRRLLDLMGKSYDGSDAGREAMMAEIPMVAFSDPVRSPRPDGRGDQGRPTS